MISRSNLSLGVATIAVVGAIALATQSLAADSVPAPKAPPAPAAAPAPAPTTQSFVGAKVKDNKGEAVGEVKGVKMGSDGKIVSLDVAVGTKTVAISGDSVSYAQADNTFVSKQSKAEITAGK